MICVRRFLSLTGDRSSLRTLVGSGGYTMPGLFGKWILTPSSNLGPEALWIARGRKHDDETQTDEEIMTTL